MSISIGIRATPNEIYYSILEDEDNYINELVSSKLIIPKALDLPEKLKFLRQTFLDLIREFHVTKAGIRLTESAAMKPSQARISYEAVILELLASSSVNNYFLGQISNIAPKLEIKRADFKKYVDGALNFEQIEGWKKFNKEKRESLLVGVAALTL